MLYLCALICPPLACLCAGRFLHACINFLMCLTVVLVPVAMIHAWLTVKDSYRVSQHGITITNSVDSSRRTLSYSGGPKRRKVRRD